jgi:hypothetical protein
MARVGIDDERGSQDAGVVDQDVQPAEFGDRRRDCGFPVRFVGDVELHESSCGAGLCDGVCCRLALGLQDVADHHRRSRVRQGLGCRGTDSARAPGDQCLASGEFEAIHAICLHWLEEDWSVVTHDTASPNTLRLLGLD